MSNSSKKRYLESLKGLSLRGDRNSQEKLGVIYQKTFNFKNSYLYYYLYYFQHVEFRPVEEKSILVKLISERFEVVEKQIGLNLSSSDKLWVQSEFRRHNKSLRESINSHLNENISR